MTTIALIVAGGRGVRAGGGVPKQYRALGGVPVLRRAALAFVRHDAVDGVRIVIGAEDRALYDATIAGLGLPPPAIGGATRQASVLAGIEAIGDATRVLIHDAARPAVPPAMIDRVLAALDRHDGAVPVLPVVDTLVRDDGEAVVRAGLHRVQTPQGFWFDAIRGAHRAAKGGDATDDAGLARAAGLRVAMVTGDEAAAKLTTEADFARAEAMLAPPMLTRVGTGFDVHRFGPGDHVMLCGLRVPHDHGVIAHSDGDVGLHALTDALLGAAGLGDIGEHFPPSDDRWRNAASHHFLAHAAGLIAAAGGVIDHVDMTIIAERPKVGPRRAAMRERLAELLGLRSAAVSVKATTTEGLGFTGRGEGIACQAVATIRMPPGD